MSSKMLTMELNKNFRKKHCISVPQKQWCQYLSSEHKNFHSYADKARRELAFMR